MVLTHFTLVYFRLSPHTYSWAQQEEGPLSWSREGWQWREAGGLVGGALPSCQLIWLRDDSIRELIVLKTRN